MLKSQYIFKNFILLICLPPNFQYKKWTSPELDQLIVQPEYACLGNHDREILFQIGDSLPDKIKSKFDWPTKNRIK